jgi:Xaa-Pro aminopeptidase
MISKGGKGAHRGTPLGFIGHGLGPKLKESRIIHGSMAEIVINENMIFFFDISKIVPKSYEIGIVDNVILPTMLTVCGQ